MASRRPPAPLAAIPPSSCSATAPVRSPAPPAPPGMPRQADRHVADPRHGSDRPGVTAFVGCCPPKPTRSEERCRCREGLGRPTARKLARIHPARVVVLFDVATGRVGPFLDLDHLAGPR